MDETTIRCPKCNASIKLTDAVAAPLLETARAQFAKDLAAARSTIATEERAKAQAEALLTSSNELAEMRAAAARADANAAALRQTLQEQNTRLKEALQEQARLTLKEHELDAARQELDLTVAKRVRAEAEVIRIQAQQAAESTLSLKVAERDEQIAAMTRQIDDLKQRAEQGSQQLQGEAQELVLEQMLHTRFPVDGIEPVAKGAVGGDVLQRVVGPVGQQAGAILWESKRTKNWNDSWLAKLREDQRTIKAEVALLVTQALPRSMDGEFDLVDGVWVVQWASALSLAAVLRQSLIEMSNVRAAVQGQQGKMELMYNYLTGSQFKLRVSAIVEKFTLMAEDLTAERKATMRLWARREAQIQGALDASAGMYGDLQGIAGRSMPAVKELELKEIE